jgi:hypothetical protein
MGTRSVIKFQESGETICAIYQQFDGYPDCVGRDLADFLTGMTIVNGISSGQPERIANGMGCLAAQFIAEQKNDAGGFYMTHIDDEQEYVYVVNSTWEGEGFSATLSEPEITVYNYGDNIFTGNVNEFLNFCSGGNDNG